MTRLIFLMMLVVIDLLAASTRAGTHNEKLSVGDAAPAFADIIGIDDKKHGLADFKEAKAVVFVFICNHCSVARAYEERLVAIQEEYGKRGVQVVAMNVNLIRADRLDKMKERAKKQKFNFPYLFDESQKTGRDYGAIVTPQTFLLDANRKIVYMGAIDNNEIAEKATKPFLRDALEAHLAGKKIETSETKPLGCGIKYDK